MVRLTEQQQTCASDSCWVHASALILTSLGPFTSLIHWTCSYLCHMTKLLPRDCYVEYVKQQYVTLSSQHHIWDEVGNWEGREVNEIIGLKHNSWLFSRKHWPFFWCLWTVRTWVTSRRTVLLHNNNTGLRSAPMDTHTHTDYRAETSYEETVNFFCSVKFLLCLPSTFTP